MFKNMRLVISLCKKWNFSLKISLVNLTKSAGICGFGHLYWRNRYWKTLFFVQCFFDMLVNRSFKMATSFANIARFTASTSEFRYQERFQSIRNWGFIWKKIIFFLNEWETSLMLKFSLQNSLPSFESLFWIWCEKLPIYSNLKYWRSDLSFNWFWLLENL